MKSFSSLRLCSTLALIALAAAGCTASTASGPTGAASSSNKTGTAAASGAPEISNRAKLLFEDALKAFETQKKAKALNYASLENKFEAALDADENLAEANYNLGVLAERQGKYDEAREQYEEALQKKPSLHQAAENLAVMEQNAGNVSGAVARYQDILKRFPEEGGARARLAELYRQAGDQDKAMELARAALVREPHSIMAYKVMMRSYLDRKQLSMAKLVALRATKLDENDPELYHAVALIFLQEGKVDDARLQFKRALEIRPDFLPSHQQMAQLSLDAEDYVSAEQHLRRVLQANGKNAAAQLNLGVALKGQGQYDKAMQAYDAAEKINPELPAIYLNRGIILQKVKDAPERALDLYKKYLALSGGEVAVNAEAPIFNLIKEAEEVIQAKDEAKRAEEEAKRMEAVAAQEAKLQAEHAAEEKKDLAKAAPESSSTPAKVVPAKGPAPTPTAKERPAPKVKDADEPADELDAL